MESFQASDVMSRNVIKVTPDTPLADLARLLIDDGANAAVVMADDRVVGVVSEGDLLRRPETGTEGKPAWWLGLLGDPIVLARRFIKTHGRLVRDAMSSPAVTVADDAPLSAVADLLERRKIKQVPVTSHGHVVGMVSRRDIVRMLATRFAAAARECDDATIRTVLQERLAAATWTHAAHLNASVHDGVVELDGWVKSPDERRALQLVAETIPGVHGVRDHLVELDIATRDM